MRAVSLVGNVADSACINSECSFGFGNAWRVNYFEDPRFTAALPQRDSSGASVGNNVAADWFEFRRKHRGAVDVCGYLVGHDNCTAKLVGRALKEPEVLRPFRLSARCQ